MTKKRIVISLIFICFIALLWFVFRGEAKITNYPPQGDTIVMFGDSLVSGVGATEGKDLPALISEKIGLPVLNLGRSGDTTNDALSRLENAVSRKPNIAIVLLGGNDALRRVSLVETNSNLRQIILAFQNIGAVTVLLGVRGGLLGDPYNSMYENLAKSTGSVYVSDILSGLFTNPRYMSDGIHPNDLGYSKIADRVAPIISKLLKHTY